MGRQAAIPGTEDPVIEEIEEAADKLYKVRLRRKKANKEEGAANDALVEAMRKHKRHRITLSDGHVVTVETVTKAKLKEPKAEKKKKAADEE